VAAFAVWGRALAADPEELALLGPLTRLADGHGLWPELAGLLDRVIGGGLSADGEQALATELGKISEDRLADLPRAAAAFERASRGPAPRDPLADLARVLARASRFVDLAAVLRRQAEAAASDAQTAEHLYRLGDLAETTLHDGAAAVAAYREVLELVPAHAPSRGALERLLGQPALDAVVRGEIVEILEPLFERDGDPARLLRVLEARVGLTDDPLDRAGLLARVVDLAESRLGDRAQALDAALRWLAVDPGASAALAEVDRLADRLGQWPEVGARVATIVAAGDAPGHGREPDVQIALLCYLGRLRRERLSQLDGAVTSYQAALALEPGNLVALDELVRIHRQRQDTPALIEALRQRGEVVPELPAKRAAFAEVAALCERVGDNRGAIAAWRSVVDLDDDDRDALDQLARLYRAGGDNAAFLETLGRAARLARSPADEKALRVQLAELQPDPHAAVDAWRQVLELDPDDLAALTSLEAACARVSDWLAVGEVQGRRLALARSTADKVAILGEMARLAETRRGAIDDAVASWYQILDLDGSQRGAFAELERLLTAASRWHDLVELFERQAELLATLGDNAAEIAVLAKAADVWEGRLDDPHAAGELLEKILRREPSSVAALTRLSKIYERSGDWARCKALLEQALGLAPRGRDAADLFFRLGEVARVGDSDLDTASQHYKQALQHDGGHEPALAALEGLARERRDNALLGDVLRRRLAAAGAQPVAARIALAIELAELERKAGDPAGALSALEAARRDAPDDLRVLAPLADAMVAANRLDEAAPLYERLADDARAGRRLKDVARFRQRQGGLLEARGDAAGAIAAYEEALRVNPTDVSTMAGLGRLYLAAKDWEKARRIYQSLVLQNIDGDAGVTKADVYWALGTIHLELGQPPKAKSMFQRGIELDPHHGRLKAALAALG
jgi:tetratricopeptide (TPR) repeat protein